jgi:hypothetical protein
MPQQHRGRAQAMGRSAPPCLRSRSHDQSAMCRHHARGRLRHTASHHRAHPRASTVHHVPTEAPARPHHSRTGCRALKRLWLPPGSGPTCARKLMVRLPPAAPHNPPEVPDPDSPAIRRDEAPRAGAAPPSNPPGAAAEIKLPSLSPTAAGLSAVARTASPCVGAWSGRAHLEVRNPREWLRPRSSSTAGCRSDSVAFACDTGPGPFLPRRQQTRCREMGRFHDTLMGMYFGLG